MEMVGESLEAYHLLLKEQQLSSQYSQDPATARKLINFIPSRAGDLKRKPYSPPFSNTEINISGNDYWYSFAREFRFYDASGDPDLQMIIGVSNNSATFLYKFVSGGTITALYGDAVEFSSWAKEVVESNPDVVKAYRRVKDKTALGLFSHPVGMAIDEEDRLIVTDTTRGRLQVYAKEKNYLDPQFNL